MPTLITVTGTYITPDDTASTGSVIFQLTAPLLDADGGVIISTHLLEVVLDEVGTLNVDLYATDDPEVQPTGVTYQVTEVIDLQRRVYNVTIPYNVAGGTVDMSELAEATDQVSYTYATTAALTIEAETRADDDANLTQNISNEIAGRVASVATVNSNLAALDAVAARVTELIASITLQTTITSTTVSVPFIFVAPFACTLNYAALVLGGASVNASSETNYWSIEIRRYRAGTPATIATKTTQQTGGLSITTKVPWVFETNTFDADNKVLQAGDVVAIFFTLVISAVSLGLCHVTVGYTPS